MARRLGAHTLAVLWLLACDGPRSQGEETRAGSAIPEAEVVARVFGVPIGIAEVRALATSRGLPLREALRLIEDAHVMERHAQVLGFGETAATATEVTRASVALLLTRAVTDVAPGDVEAQRRSYTELVSSVRARTPVFFHEDTIREALADPDLFASPGSR